MGAYAGLVAIATLTGLGLLAVALDEPLLFPSLGPTVMVLAERPGSASAHPRNVFAGHLVGTAVGVVALFAFGLWHAPGVMGHEITLARVGAAAGSLAVTAFLLQLMGTPHAPAGATTLIVSLGLMKTPRALIAILAAVALVTLVAVALNLLTGRRRTLATPREPDRRRPGARTT